MGVIKVAVYDAKNYDKVSFLRILKQECLEDQFEFIFLEPRLSTATVEFCRGCDAVCAFVNDDLGTEIIASLDEMNIRLILMRCAGFDRVDTDACKELQISVVRVPAYSPHAVAEFATALLLTVVRKTHRAFNRVRDSNFTLSGLVGFDIHGKTVGVLGTGRIGQCFIDIMLGFGCTVFAYDVYQSDVVKAKGVKYLPTIEEVLAKADIVSLHMPLNKDTQHLLNRNTINAMKAGAIVLNTARGPLIDGKALVDGLVTGRIGGAGLDVYENETNYFFRDMSDADIDDEVLARLQNMRNVVLTSHQAFLTEEALSAIAQTTLFSLKEYFVERKQLSSLTHYVAPPEPPAALVKALSKRMGSGEKEA